MRGTFGRSVLIGAMLVATAVVTPGANAADNTGATTAPPPLPPNATYLCAKADAGKLEGDLAKGAAAVKEACGRLRAAVTSSSTTYRTIATSLRTQGTAAVETSKRSCREAIAKHNTAACAAARARAIATLRSLREQARRAATTYATTQTTARTAFWTRIHGLAGGARLPADTAAVPAPPAAGIPEDSAVSAT
ncbi:MAG: hypothetical protein JWN72_1861 [Thermoleophilia bacterium]|nr:hypothetical protein [Thermoleophilia bacterium]